MSGSETTISFAGFGPTDINGLWRRKTANHRTILHIDLLRNWISDALEQVDS